MSGQEPVSQIPNKWEELSKEEKFPAIISALLLNEMGAVDSTFTFDYMSLRSRTSDLADQMQLDLEYHERISKLREEGRVSTAEELRQQAEEIVGLSSGDMLKALSALYQKALERLGG